MMKEKLEKVKMVLRDQSVWALVKHVISRVWLMIVRPFKKLVWLGNYKKLKQSENFKEGSIALMTVFIMKENVRFLDEWIQHNLLCGVDHFFLYDNSKVTAVCDLDKGAGRKTEPGKVNRHGIDYSNIASDQEAAELFQSILRKYEGKVTVVPWQMRGADGEIGYFQLEAFNDFVGRWKGEYDYGLFTDMDEYLMSGNGISLRDVVADMEQRKVSSIRFKPRFFSSRFNHTDKKVLEIDVCCPIRHNKYHKSLVKLSTVLKMGIHNTRTIFTDDVYDEEEMVMHHYCISDDSELPKDEEVVEFVQTYRQKLRANRNS